MLSDLSVWPSSSTRTLSQFLGVESRLASVLAAVSLRRVDTLSSSSAENMMARSRRNTPAFISRGAVSSSSDRLRIAPKEASFASAFLSNIFTSTSLPDRATIPLLLFVSVICARCCAIFNWVSSEPVLSITRALNKTPS